MLTLIAFCRADFPETCGDSTYEGPIVDENQPYLDKRCITFTDVENITLNDVISLTAIEWINLPDTIYVETSAFGGFKTLKTVILPKAETIGIGSFINCTSLTDVQIPLVNLIRIMAFKNTNLEEFNGPSVTTIDSNAFANCANLKSINLSAAINLEAYSFADCTSLTNIEIPNALSLDFRCFANCTSVKVLYLPQASVVRTSVVNMVSLEEINTPKVTSFYVMFENAPNFKKLIAPLATSLVIMDLPSSIEEVDISSIMIIPSIFTGRQFLRSILAPKAITLSPFTNCISLKEFSAPLAFSAPTACFAGCTSLTKVYLPELNEVPEDCFKGCISLQKVDFIAIQLKESSFEGCTAIEELSLPSVMALKGDHIFKGMKKLRTLNITKVYQAYDSKGVFEDCESLEIVHLACQPPNGFEEDAFNVSRNTVNVTVPAEKCLEQYKSKSVSKNHNLYFKGAYLMPQPPENTHLVKYILIGVGVAVVIAIVVVVVFIVIRRRRSDPKYNTNLL